MPAFHEACPFKKIMNKGFGIISMTLIISDWDMIGLIEKKHQKQWKLAFWCCCFCYCTVGIKSTRRFTRVFFLIPTTPSRHVQMIIHPGMSVCSRAVLFPPKYLLWEKYGFESYEEALGSRGKNWRNRKECSILK